MPTATVNGTTLDYDLIGTGTPLLLIHGGLIARSEWRLQIEPLAQSCRLIVPDVRGHGASGKGGDYSMKLFAEDFVALLENLGIARAIVCGHSMGGTVAQVMAADYPDRVIGLILAETNYGVGNEPMMRFAAGATTALTRLIGVKSFLKMGARTMKANDPQIVSAIQAAFQRQADDPANARNIIDAMNAYDGSALLARIHCPTLVIIGADNRLARQQGEHMAKTIPNARLTHIPNAGHGANWDNAPAFNAAVLEFTGGLPAT
ncbi:MAG: alpha/beta hydrolase [Chloroflexota bacterium]